MEQRCHFKSLAQTQHVTVLYGKEHVKKFLDWYFLQLHESQRLWNLQLFKVQGEIPTSTAPNPLVVQESPLNTQ